MDHSHARGEERVPILFEGSAVKTAGQRSPVAASKPPTDLPRVDLADPIAEDAASGREQGGSDGQGQTYAATQSQPPAGAEHDPECRQPLRGG